MAKNTEKNKTNAMLNAAQGQQANYTTNYLQNTAPERAQARANANDLYSTISGGYKDLAANKGITPELTAALGAASRGGGGMPVPNFNTGMFGDVQNSYRNFMGGGGVDLSQANKAMGILGDVAQTGGWSAADRAAQNKNIAGLTSMGETGGLDDAAMARMRGNGVYDEFAQTGGYTPGQAQDFRARATSVIPSIYANAKAQADQMGRVTGQYNPAAMAKMSRQAGYDSQKAATDAEVQLQDSIRANRLQGAQGASSSETALQGLRTSNMLQGLTSAGSERAAMLNAIAGNQTGAATGLGNLDVSAQGLVQQGKMFGTSGLSDLASKQLAAQHAAASAGNAAAAQNAANAKWLAEFGVNNQEAGLQGLGGLYTSSPAEVAYYDTAQRQMLGQNTGQTVDVGQARIANNPQRDWASTIGGLVGSAAGAMTGMGALGMGVKAAKNIGSAGSSGMAGLWG